VVGLTGHGPSFPSRADPANTARQITTSRERCTAVSVEKTPLATVGALVVSPSKRVLLILTHKWRNTWGVPGGKILYGERLRAALVREIHEETRLDIDNVRWAPTQEMVRSKSFFRPAHFILLNFVACSDCEEVTLNEEAQDYTWVFPKNALDYNLNDPTRHLVNHFLEYGHTGSRLGP
jgi:8-oxo-dGTP pyrophosphatase MutT (NUDIX family)